MKWFNIASQVGAYRNTQFSIQPKIFSQTADFSCVFSHKAQCVAEYIYINIYTFIYIGIYVHFV